MRNPIWLLLPLVIACGKDVKDDVLPTDTDLPVVGSDVIKFHGRAPKNLLFLSIDTFRRDHMGPYQDRDLTPFLSKIAAEGVTLDDHRQCSDWTYGSTTCTLAGRTNPERGQMPRLNGTDEQRTKVPDGTPFLATWLGEAGYYSIIISGNDWLSKNWGNTQGYDEEQIPGGNAYEVENAGMAAMAGAIDRGDVKDGWFLHMHFMEPHASYDPPEENIIGEEAVAPWPEDLTNRDIHYKWRDEWLDLSPEDQSNLNANLQLLYDGEIRTIDQRLEDVWNDLENEGYLDDTLVVIWNDHGEAFWEHGHQTHAFELYNEENNAFAVFWARNIVPGSYAGPTSGIDLVPTVLNLLDVPIPDEVTGYPAGSAPEDRVRFADALARTGGVNMAVRDGKKLQFNWEGDVDYFDEVADPYELNDLYDPDDPEVLALWTAMRPQIEKMADAVVGGPLPLYPPELP